MQKNFDTDDSVVDRLLEENGRLSAENGALRQQLELFHVNANLHAATVMSVLLSWIDKSKYDKIKIRSH